MAFVGQDGGIELARVVVDGDEEMFSGGCFGFSGEKRKPLSVEVDEFTGVLFIVTASLTLEFCFELVFDFGESFDSVLEAAEATVNARAWSEFLDSGALDDFVNGGSTDSVALG